MRFKLKSKKMKNIVVIFAILANLLFSCKKEENTPKPDHIDPAVNNNLIPMREGNYWIYQEYSRDSMGNILSISPNLDSLVLEPMNGSLEFKLYRITTTPVVSPNIMLYPLFTLSDSGTFYKINERNLYVIPKNSLPFNSPQYFSMHESDTIFTSHFKVSETQNPLPGNNSKAILIETTIPKAYLVMGTINNRNIWIEGIGLYQWELSFATQPYPNMAKRLIRYNVNQN